MGSSESVADTRTVHSWSCLLVQRLLIPLVSRSSEPRPSISYLCWHRSHAASAWNQQARRDLHCWACDCASSWHVKAATARSVSIHIALQGHKLLGAALSRLQGCAPVMNHRRHLSGHVRLACHIKLICGRMQNVDVHFTSMLGITQVAVTHITHLST